MMYRDIKIEIPPRLLELLRGFPAMREVEHCGKVFEAPPFDIYATCPTCGAKIKVRSFADVIELEDVFDAVFHWIERNGADEVVKRRRETIRQDVEDDGDFR